MPETQSDKTLEPMMTDGYLLLYNDRDEPQLIVRTNSGWGSARITQQDIDEGRLPEIVRAKQESVI